MLYKEDNVPQCITQTMSWDLNMNLTNADVELQWLSCTCFDGIRVLVIESSLKYE